MGRGGRSGLRRHRDAGPVLALSLGVRRVGGWQGLQGRAGPCWQSCTAFTAWSPLACARVGGRCASVPGSGNSGARTAAFRTTAERSSSLQALSSAHRSQQVFLQLISVKAGSGLESIKERYHSQMQGIPLSFSLSYFPIYGALQDLGVIFT